MIDFRFADNSLYILDTNLCSQITLLRKGKIPTHINLFPIVSPDYSITVEINYTLNK